MKKKNGLTFLVFVLVLFCQGNILYGGEVSKKKAWANFKPLVAEKETKRLYKQGEMDSIQNKYLANVKKVVERNNLKGKLEIYYVTKTMGDVSIDTQYAAIVKSYYLMPVVNGVKVTESNMHVNYRLFDELTFMDGSTNVLWTKKYNINGKYSGIYLKKILKNGKRLLVTTPYSGKDFKTEYYGEYGYEIDDFVVYDKKGIEIFKSQYNAAVTDPRMTDNGKYVYFTDSINYETNYDRCIFFNVDRKDSVYLNVPSLKFGSVEIEDDGNILLWSTTTRIRLHFDSLKVKPWKWEE